MIGASDGASALSRAVINSAAGGDILPVAAVAGQIIRVYKIWLVNTAATSITFKDGAGGTAVSGPAALAANGSLVFDFDGEPWYVTSLGNAFAINSSAATQVSGTMYFTQTPNVSPP
jgi:hypothetical protein